MDHDIRAPYILSKKTHLNVQLKYRTLDYLVFNEIRNNRCTYISLHYEETKKLLLFLHPTLGPINNLMGNVIESNGLANIETKGNLRLAPFSYIVLSVSYDNFLEQMVVGLHAYENQRERKNSSAVFIDVDILPKLRVYLNEFHLFQRYDKPYFQRQLREG